MLKPTAAVKVQRDKEIYLDTLKASQGKPAAAPLEITEGTFDVGMGF